MILRDKLKEKNRLKIIYEDNHLLVLSKPAGLLAVPDSTGDASLLDLAKAYIKKTKKKPGDVFLGVVHRIDRPVSGLVCFAKTSKAASRLSEQMRAHAIQKTYLALTKGMPLHENGIFEHMLRKDRTKNIVELFPAGVEEAGAKSARTIWRVIKKKNDLCLLELTPETGRPHQLRSQCAYMGLSILGDVKYGAAAPLADGSIALHAFKLALCHPTKKELLIFEAPLPALAVWQEFVLA